MQQFVVSNLPNMFDLGYISHFKHCTVLKENLFKSLKQIMLNLGKKQFRNFVDEYLDVTFKNSRL